MTRIFLPLAVFIGATALDAEAQRMGAPDPALIVAMEQVKDQCTKDTPCKYKVQPFGERTIVTIEFTRKETPASEPQPYPGGRAQLYVDKQGKVVNRLDGDQIKSR
jgi:hypothetical protein